MEYNGINRIVDHIRLIKRSVNNIEFALVILIYAFDRNFDHTELHHQSRLKKLIEQ